MVGAALRKYAGNHNLKHDGGIIYGELKGYNVTMHEGGGWKMLSVSTKFPDPEQRHAFEAALSSANISTEYRIKDISATDNQINFMFADTVGTMTRIEGFIDWLMPLLAQHGATDADVCTACGCAMSGQGQWVLMDNVAQKMHEACLISTTDRIRSNEAQLREEDTGSYFLGFIGALLGGLLGSAIWAGLMYMGFIAGIVGFLIGFFAEKGYRLLKGKNGKGKLAILIVAILICIAAGTFFGELVACAKVLKENHNTFYTPMEFLLLLLKEDPGVRSGVIKDFALGLLFAGLGVFGLLRKTNTETSGTQIKRLK